MYEAWCQFLLKFGGPFYPLSSLPMARAPEQHSRDRFDEKSILNGHIVRVSMQANLVSLSTTRVLRELGDIKIL
jgi:hypothetical protein